VAFDVSGTYNSNTGAFSRAVYIRLYRGQNLVRQNDIYWNVSNGEVWQYQGADNYGTGDLTFVKLERFLDSTGLNVGPTSGARITITNNLISVYDSSNVLRVRMGVW
jgi:hypothetical protein